MVAAVAADEPDTAAKIAQPMILTCNNRPGRPPSHGDRPLNMSSDKRDRNRISPIRMNSGSAASAHEWLAPHSVVARTWPTGAFEKKTSATVPTDNSAMATHTPKLRRPSSTPSRTSMMIGSDIYSCSIFSRTGSRAFRVAMNKSMKAIVSISNPAEVAS